MGREEEAEMMAAGQGSRLPLPTSLWLAIIQHQAKLQGQTTALKVLKTEEIYESDDRVC